MAAKTKTIASQPSWIVRNDSVELAITQLGGHLAPVTFFPDSKAPVQPYWINPWHKDNPKLPKILGVLKPLRGDFFCMPFGANLKEHNGEQHPVHGEPAVKKWKFKSLDQCDDIARLTLTMNTRARKGKVVKHTMIKAGQSAVYQTHVLSGFTGAMPVGNHHTLALPLDKPESVLVGSSAIQFGMTNPTPAGNPADGEYSYLAGGEKFAKIEKVPTLFKKPATCDCSAFPTRKGYGDLMQIYHKATDTPAWVTATYTADGYLWYSLKDAATLPATLFWIYNHSRWPEPWAGKSACLGLENTCSYFAEGLADSVKANTLTRAGIPTAIKLSPKTPSEVDVIQGVVRVPKGFGKVTAADFTKNKVTFISGKKKAAAKVNWEFLLTGEL